MSEPDSSEVPSEVQREVPREVQREPADAERRYLALVARCIESGDKRGGRNGVTRSVFGESLVFDASVSFPLLTTKRVFWRGVVEELLWFLRGSTNARELSSRGVHIWDGNSSREYLDSRGLEYPEGELGPVYGWQWRRFGAAYPGAAGGGGVDQVAYVIETLMADRTSRRAFMSAWNPAQLSEMALPPCHVSYQFYVTATSRLSCQVYCRSQDLCCGTPFNVASTALLTAIIAAALGLAGASRIHLAIGDAHVYETHVDAAVEQVAREPRGAPTLVIKRPGPDTGATVADRVAWVESLAPGDFVLDGYEPHAAIKYTMVA
jgi:thymidylate synthase